MHRAVYGDARFVNDQRIMPLLLNGIMKSFLCFVTARYNSNIYVCMICIDIFV